MGKNDEVVLERNFLVNMVILLNKTSRFQEIEVSKIQYYFQHER